VRRITLEAGQTSTRGMRSERSIVPVGDGPHVVHELLGIGELAEGQAPDHLDELLEAPLSSAVESNGALLAG
jgi:hypothetical protein